LALAQHRSYMRAVDIQLTAGGPGIKQREVSFVDQELERRLSEAEMAGLRRGLAALGEIKQSLAGPVLRRGLSQ
jgi:hypothetical protein